MSLATADKSAAAVDIDLVTQGLTEFSILRRNENIYPRQHPSIAPSARKVITFFNRITAAPGSITIGIAQDGLLLADTPLERRNPVFREIARSLFSHEIAALTISHGIDSDELLAFIKVINSSPGEIAAAGGIVQAVAAAGVARIRITAIDYSAFKLTEEESITAASPAREERAASLLWERFVRGIINDVLDQEGELAVSYSRVSPDLLADLINRQQGELAAGRTLSYAQAIVQFFRKAKRDGYGDEVNSVSRFLSQLHPELRREFLVSSLDALKDDGKLASQLLAELSSDAIFDALVEMNNRGESVSPYLRALMERLSSLGASRDLISAAAKDGGFSKVELADKLQSVLKDDTAELYLPVDYEALIRTIISTEQISTAEMEERELLLSSLVGHPLELQLNAIILNLLEQPTGEDRPEALQQHVVDMLAYFLGIGDFDELCRIHDRLDKNIADQALRQELLCLFATPDFINEVLGTIAIWGKAKFGAIQSLISRVGTPFLIPTLDKLAAEESMSLRRFYMDRLREFGTAAVEPTVARLHDERWYVIRNMLVLLRRLDAVQTVSQVRRLLSHPHPRVHQEVIRTLIYFQDPEADRQLLLGLSSDKRDEQFAALQLAETSKNPQVSARLLELLTTGKDFELKIAALRALAAIGNPIILPELGQLLKTGSILHPIAMHKFKLEIIRSLERFPLQPAAELLATIPAIGNKELISLADEISRRLKVKRT